MNATTTLRSRPLLAVALLVALSAGVLVAAQPVPTHWTGFVSPPPDAPKVGVSDIEIRVFKLSNDEEAMTLVNELKLGGQVGLRNAMYKLEDKGWVRLGKFAATGVGVVRALELPDGRRVLRVFSAYPARIFDRSDPVGTPDHPFAYIELVVDKDGKGSGQMISAASLKVSDQGLELESAGAPIVAITDVVATSED